MSFLHQMLVEVEPVTVQVTVWVARMLLSPDGQSLVVSKCPPLRTPWQPPPMNDQPVSFTVPQEPVIVSVTMTCR